MMGIQATIYAYWKTYPEFSDIRKATKFAQKIYMGKHRYSIRLIEKMLEAQGQLNSVKEKTKI